jgi:hypothetical protein
MDRYCGPPQLHALSWAQFWFVAVWQTRDQAVVSIGQKPWRSVRANCSCFKSIFCLGNDFGLRVETERTTMKDDLDDIPMAYFLYVLLAIAAIVAAAAIVITRMF